MEGHEHPNMTMNNLVASVKATGAIGVVGVFTPEDPKSPDRLERHGQIAFEMGRFFEKGLDGLRAGEREAIQPEAHGADPPWEGAPRR